MIGELAALGAAISWSLSALLYKQALSEIRPVPANIIRLTVTGVLLLAFLAVINNLAVLTALPVSVIILAGISGIIGLGLGDTLYMISLRMIGVARSVPVTCTYPLFNLLIAAFFLREPLTWAVAVGAVVIVLGIWLLSREKENDVSGLQRKVLNKGLALALAAAILWAASIGMMGQAAKEASSLDDAFAINVVRVSTIAVCFAASAPFIGRSSGPLRVRKRTVAALIAGGLVALGLGWFFLAYSFTQTLESRAVPISAVTPLFSTLEGVILLGEKINIKNALGSVMIVAGVFVVFLL
jgi:DME family drug/metabolite transporter